MKLATLNVSFQDDDDFGQLSNTTILINTKALRNKDITIANIINGNDFASRTDTDIVVHEYGHFLSSQYGKKGIDYAKKALYNIYNREYSDEDVLTYLRENVSTYSANYDENIYDMMRKFKHSEIVSEVFTKHQNAPDDFTTEFMKLWVRRK